MKKIFGLVAVLALVAGCNSNTSDTVTVLDATCEKVTTFTEGDMVVKCPITEQLQALQTQEANSMFVQGGDLKLNELAADAEHIYVNVIPAGSYEWAPKTEYRVMVKEPVFEEGKMWTVSMIAE